SAAHVNHPGTRAVGSAGVNRYNRSMEITIRPAVEADVPFIAWVQQEAARSHLPLGFWDLAFPGAGSDRLRVVGRIAKAKPRSFCHYSGFLVAEADGYAAAALSAYTRPSIAAGSAL